jgi:hypothetical protein
LFRASNNFEVSITRVESKASSKTILSLQTRSWEVYPEQGTVALVVGSGVFVARGHVEDEFIGEFEANVQKYLNDLIIEGG